MTLRVSTGDVILQAAHSVTDPDVVRYNLGSLDRALVASSDRFCASSGSASRRSTAT
ncbi:MAG: hypothetical protein U0599_09180 [Vicinamibacteria bacterium]